VTGFDTFVMVDWSGGNDTGPRPRRDAIWACRVQDGHAQEPVYLRNRMLAEAWLSEQIERDLTSGRRVLLGFDFPFAYPAGFSAAVTGTDNPLSQWDWFEARIEDAPRLNNRFDLAGAINRRVGAGHGPFWANGLKRDISGLPRTKTRYRNPFPDRRVVERFAKGSFTCWQMAGAGAVGSQVMMGLPVLSRLRRRFPEKVAVWPFEPLDTPVALVEIWPSLTVGTPPSEMIKDAWQVQQVALGLNGLERAELALRLDVHAPEEGWILGVDPSLARCAA